MRKRILTLSFGSKSRLKRTQKSTEAYYWDRFLHQYGGFYDEVLEYVSFPIDHHWRIELGPMGLFPIRYRRLAL